MNKAKIRLLRERWSNLRYKERELEIEEKIIAKWSMLAIIIGAIIMGILLISKLNF